MSAHENRWGIEFVPISTTKLSITPRKRESFETICGRIPHRVFLQHTLIDSFPFVWEKISNEWVKCKNF